MKRIGVFCLFFMTLCMGFCSSIYAGDLPIDRSSCLTVTPSVGFYRYADKRNIDSEVMVPVYVGYGFSDHLSGEFFYAGLSSNAKQRDNQSVDGEVYALDALYHFRTFSPWQPFVTAGVGATQLNPPASGDAKTQTTLNAGFGIEYGFNPRITLRMGARDFLTMVGGKQDVLVDMGLTIYLWKFTQAAP